MERIKKRWKNLSLKKAYFITVLSLVGMVVLLSAVTILCCLWGRNYLLPDADSAYLTVEKQYEDGSVVTEIISISQENGEWTPFVKGYEDGEPGEEEAGEDISEGAEIAGGEGKTEEEMGGGTLEGERDEKGEEDVEGNAQFIIGTDGVEFVEDKEEQKVLEKYNILKMENGYSSLTPKRKLVYRGLGAAMVFFPVVYTFLGIFISAVWFYRHKMSQPIRALEQAIGQIQIQNLEFEVADVGEDELGQVCASLEEMRKTLYRNNQELWNMLEERKRLQASVAHDLRNPITIIRTYVEYVKLNLTEGNVTEEQLGSLMENIQVAAKRLEQYTDSIRDISKLEEIETHLKPVDLTVVLPEMEEELGILAQKEQKAFGVDISETALDACVDVSVLYRILENLVANAARYAREALGVSCQAEAEGVCIRVWDDGPGFPKKVLSEGRTYFTTADSGDGHMGMGLSICRILCRKMQGRLKLHNRENGGAEAEIFLYHR